MTLVGPYKLISTEKSGPRVLNINAGIKIVHSIRETSANDKLQQILMISKPSLLWPNTGVPR